jgi:DNA-binding response OmpR family regulator
MRLLLAVADGEAAQSLRALLRAQRFEVEHAACGALALEHLAAGGFDLLLLELRLPDMDGRGVLRRLRRARDDIPVLVLAAGAPLEIRLDSLELGADDCLAASVEPRELLLRVKALLRRRSGRAPLRCADLEYNLDSREFRAAGQPLALTPCEHALLEALMLCQGSTLGKAALARRVLGSEADAARIEVHVHRLRRKLVASQARIVTLRGLGYLLRGAASPCCSNQA